MKLQTQITLPLVENQIDYDSKVVLLGSCFSKNMGDLFSYFQFQNLQNPFGIIFNPISSEILIDRAIAGREFTEEDIFYSNEQWHCFEVHSLISSLDKTAYLDKLNQLLHTFTKFLTSASHIFLTFGTAWVYKMRTTKQIVANCHKVGQQEFDKELLSVNQISESIKNSIRLIRKVNINGAIITTLSPVRHTKDGMVQNSLSKAQLLSGIHAAIANQTHTHYFPAYELMMDEMRDYRYYKSDLIHPNQTAIALLWEKLKQVWITPKTEALQKEIALIQKGLDHRPFNPNSLAHLKFQKSLQEKIERLQKQIPHARFH